MANGQTVYPNSNGQYPWGQYAYYNPNANTDNYQYDYNHAGNYDRTGRHHRDYDENNNGRWHHHDDGRR
jgi:hypothetical protein